MPERSDGERFERLIGNLSYLLIVPGFVWLVGAVIAFADSSYAGAAGCAIAASLGFGTVLSALARR